MEGSDRGLSLIQAAIGCAESEDGAVCALMGPELVCWNSAVLTVLGIETAQIDGRRRGASQTKTG